MSRTTDDRCRARTRDGERCSRPAGADGFCYQHDESDPTVDERPVEADGGDAAETDETAGGDGNEAADGDENGGDAADAPTVGGSDVADVRETVRAVGRDLIGHELDTISRVERDGDGWRVTLEMVERRAVPDTQDILGRYEVDLDDDRTVSGYRRVGRYRRADTDRDDRVD